MLGLRSIPAFDLANSPIKISTDATNFTNKTNKNDNLTNNFQDPVRIESSEKDIF